ncbi:MAG: hypothetical protein NZ699_01775 [Roseiflexus sp.]|nr:hypothetical protein [Roseiflexus sp.]MCS7287840.1 hypothetical protein [Roseiflexus sp.]MDW8147018.1 hypothetical protein [Roseiflexaceae bacterium]MDW8233476.1 hypothetical protein [Roseiflexaceae bacterium]
MSDFLSVVMPRRLRLHASVQIAGMRMPARAFLMIVGVAAIGGIAISLGAEIERTIWISGGLIVVGLAMLEGRVWGRSSRDAVGIVWRHLNRPKRLRMGQLRVTLPTEERLAPALALQPPRWQRREDSHE